MSFDQTTLLTVAASITALLGAFFLVLWFQERSVRALAWWGGAYVIGPCAAMLWSMEGTSGLIRPEAPNAVLFVACGMIWSGARLFHGRAVLPGVLLGGAAAWIAAMQDPGFVASDHARAALSSLIVALYAFLTAYELRRERRRELAARWLWIVIPLLHSAVFLVPVGLIVLLPTGVSAGALFALFAFETVIYVVGTAFVVVVLAKERVAHLHRTAAMTDPLTGLFNRRAFLEAAGRLIEKRGRKSLPVSVLLFDLDRFKSINDRFGHAIGDEALRAFAATASANMRVEDVIGRLGGEEFVAVIPSNAAEAGLVAERLRAAFEVAGVVVAGHDIAATVSIGIASAVAPAAIEPLLVRADAALYRAKHNGRNRVEFDNVEVEYPAAARAPVTVTASAVALTQVLSNGH